MKVCVITDNQFIYEQFLILLQEARYKNESFDFFSSPGNPLRQAEESKAEVEETQDQAEVTAEERTKETGCKTRLGQIDLKQATEEFFSQYDLFLSLHCKQLFPNALVHNHRCINVHPGFNPYNRGWYPQVFGILNRYPVGVTIHEIDEQLDHGPIIVRRQLPVHDWDTSLDIYTRIQRLEVELLREYLPVLLSGEYQTFCPDTEGNVNLEKDFKALCRLDLEQTVTWREAIDLLRATTFQGYRNAYFYDADGNKIFVEIRLEKEQA